MKKLFNLCVFTLLGTTGLYGMGTKETFKYAQQEAANVNKVCMVNLAQKLAYYAKSYPIIQKTKLMPIQKCTSQSAKKVLSHSEFKKKHIRAMVQIGNQLQKATKYKDRVDILKNMLYVLFTVGKTSISSIDNDLYYVRMVLTEQEKEYLNNKLPAIIITKNKK